MTKQNADYTFKCGDKVVLNGNKDGVNCLDEPRYYYGNNFVLDRWLKEQIILTVNEIQTTTTDNKVREIRVRVESDNEAEFDNDVTPNEISLYKPKDSASNDDVFNNKLLVPKDTNQEHLVQILLAKLQGVPVEYRPKVKKDADWCESLNSTTLDWGVLDYRLKQKEPLSLHKEVWKLLNPKWRYIAVDKDSGAFLYTEEPIFNTKGNIWELPSESDGELDALCDLIIDTTGYTPSETLIKRPEGV